MTVFSLKDRRLFPFFQSRNHFTTPPTCTSAAKPVAFAVGTMKPVTRFETPDRRTAEGRRDHALLLVMFDTGARVQERLDVSPRDLQVVRPRQVRVLLQT